MIDATSEFDACACNNLRKAARAITSLYERMIFPATGIHATQVTLLMTLANSTESTISQLAERLVIDRTTLTRDLKLLQDQGLLTVQAGEDRRTRMVRLTEQGIARLEQIRPLWRQVQAHVITNGLGNDRWKRLFNDLQAVIRLSDAMPFED